MNQRFLGAFLLLFLGISGIQSQEGSLAISPKFKFKKGQVFAGHLFSDKTGHLLAFNQYKGFSSGVTTVLTKYNPQFEELWSKDYLADKEGVASFGFKRFKNKVVWLLRDKSDKKKYTYYLLPLDKEGKTGEKKKLVDFTYDKRSEKPEIRWLTSKDSSKIAVTLVNDKDKDDADFSYFVTVLDNELDGLWSKKVTLGKSQEQIKILSDMIGEDGAHYLLVKEYNGKKAKETERGKKGEKKQPGYSLSIYRLAKGDEKPKQIKVDLGNRFAQKTTIKLDPSGRIDCIGFFSNHRYDNIAGIFFIKIGLDGSVISSNLKTFSPEEITGFGKRNVSKGKDKKKSLAGGYEIRDQFYFPDSTKLVIAEYNVVRVSSDSKGRSITTYIGLDILIIKMNLKGDILSYQFIPKGKSSFFPATISYIPIKLENEGVFFIYSDNEKNIKIPITDIDTKREHSKETVISGTYYGVNGALKRNVLLKTEDMKEVLQISECRLIEEKKVFFYYEYDRGLKRSFRLGTVELE